MAMPKKKATVITLWGEKFAAEKPQDQKDFWALDKAVYFIKQSFLNRKERIAGFVIVAVDDVGQWRVEYGTHHKVLGPRMLAALAKSAITEQLIVERTLKDREQDNG